MANDSEALPPHAQLQQMAMGQIVSRVLYAAAKLGLADELASGPKNAAELAAALGAHAPSLHRLMRALAMIGVFTEGPEHRFTLTPLGEALKTDAPGSVRTILKVAGAPFFQCMYESIEYSVRTGKPGFDKVQGMPLFEYLAQHPEDMSLFSELMVAFHGPEADAVASSYDFSTFDTIVDVGGATGNMLAAILTRYAGPRGVLYDLPHVVSEAPALLQARGVTDRIAVEPGDLFKAVPAGGDAYILSHIIHDWREDLCLTILGNCRKAMKPDSKLLIVEAVIPDGDIPHPGKMMDMVMLMQTGGQERSEIEYRALLDKADFQLTRILPTPSLASVVEARLR
jgi:O-methyltransferase domain/Dimerisation domain